MKRSDRKNSDEGSKRSRQVERTARSERNDPRSSRGSGGGSRERRTKDRDDKRDIRRSESRESRSKEQQDKRDGRRAERRDPSSRNRTENHSKDSDGKRDIGRRENREGRSMERRDKRDGRRAERRDPSSRKRTESHSKDSDGKRDIGRRENREGRSMERRDERDGRRDERRDPSRHERRQRHSNDRGGNREDERKTDRSESRDDGRSVGRGDSRQGGGRGDAPDGTGAGRGGGGRGRGMGRGAGRGARSLGGNQKFDMVVCKPVDGKPLSKQAVLGNSSEIKLRANYFTVEHRPNWTLYQFHAEYLPDEFDTKAKKLLMRPHGKTLGAYIFDGTSLYSPHRLSPDQMHLFSNTANGLQKVEIILKMVAEVAPTDVTNLQIFSIIVRKCMESMRLELMGRNFFDPGQALRLEVQRLELWPGFKTSLRNHEHNLLLGVEVMNKVLRLDNCLRIFLTHRGKPDEQRLISDELIGSIVMTSYNRKTYRVDDIDWTKTALSTFNRNGEHITFMDYFKLQYNATINEPSQPLLISQPKKRDLHRGMTGPILLVPELCNMTGFTENMRRNCRLMKALADHMYMGPPERTHKIRDFMSRMKNNKTVEEELERWGLKFSDRMVEFNGHVIPSEQIQFGEGKMVTPSQNYDWSRTLKESRMLTSCDLTSWAVIVPSRDASCVDKLIRSMQNVAQPLGIKITYPTQVIRITGAFPKDYVNAVDTVMNQHKDKMQMLFVILPRFSVEIYSAVKKRTYVDFGVPCQCMVVTQLCNERRSGSLLTNVVVQMNAKLGGEPWTVKIPLQNTMVIGFDVHHPANRRGASVGAMVSTTSPTFARYFSTVSSHRTHEELSQNMATDFTKCINAYHKANHVLPARIIMYRDGVGDGQLTYVKETELKEILNQISNIYLAAGQPKPRFTFMVVAKRIYTRLFTCDSRPANPQPGTVADNVITLPERYDFFLISQFAIRGTVSPTAYNVLYDCQGLDADKLQKLTYKLCHLYFNWAGTVSVPAPCLYARKCAFLSGVSLGGPCNEKLSNSLFFL